MRELLLIALLLVSAGIGIAHIFKPRWFVNRSGVRKGGEMLNDWNELGFQIGGALFAAFAIYLL